jgi:LysM repeat protein
MTSPRFLSWALRPVALMPMGCAALLAACGTASPIPPLNSGPSWSLSKSNNDLSAPRGGTLPTGRSDTSPQAPPASAYTYKGGRDPYSGRASPQAQPTPVVAGSPPQPQQFAPGSLPQQANRAPGQNPGVQAVTTYRPADAGGPGVPYAAPQPMTVAKGQTMTVVPGDTLTAIASRHRVSVAELMRVNNLQSPILRPGQDIRIPQR